MVNRFGLELRRFAPESARAAGYRKQLTTAGMESAVGVEVRYYASVLLGIRVRLSGMAPPRSVVESAPRDGIAWEKVTGELVATVSLGKKFSVSAMD
jgi:hypothetical protein